MFSTLAQFKSMRPPVRSLVFLYWIYSFAGGLVGVFTQIYLYQKFTSIPLNIVATVFFYTGIMVGFCVVGYAASLLKVNIKQGFFWSFLATGGAILYLLHISSIASAYFAMFVWGFGQGIFWLTVNTFELLETLDGERDFYSSVLSAGNQILSLVAPACATILILLSSTVFHFGTFTLLFTVAPIVYLLGFFCFADIRDYRPSSIHLSDIRYFFTDRKNQLVQIYTAGTGFEQIIGITIPPLALLFILGTALHVGIYDTFFAIFSAICILILAKYRTSENRLLIYGIATIGLVLVTIEFGYFLTFAALIFYTFFEGFISPVASITSHVIDLESMEIGRKETDFYPTMILRDLFLWFWRCIGGFLFLFVISLLHTEKSHIQAGLYALAAAFVISYIGAYFFMRQTKHDTFTSS